MTRVLSLLQAFVTGSRVAPAGNGPLNVNLVIEKGLGPIAAHVLANGGATVASRQIVALRAADLTARLVATQQREVLAEVLEAAATAGMPVALLKGAAVSRRYYPVPYLRAMGDVDLFVRPSLRPAFGRLLVSLGFEERSDALGTSPTARHSTPFRRSEGIWIDVHTALYPARHPLAADATACEDGNAIGMTPVPVGTAIASVMSHERQIVYTSARWAETFDPERGVFPLLDAALLLRRYGNLLDWPQVERMVAGTWAAGALRLMLASLTRLRLATIPAAVPAALVPGRSRAPWAVGLDCLVDRSIEARLSSPARQGLRRLWPTLVRGSMR